MRKWLTSLCWILCLGLTAAWAAERGALSGGVIHEMPDWFKQSFLEIEEDVAEASEADKHVLLFFTLDECPYCDRMLRESFIAEPMKALVQTHFDPIAINVKGDREIAFNEDITVTEKQLSEILKVRATPAILFLDADNKTVVRVNGFRAPERFREILGFVSSRAYRDGDLADYLDKRLRKDVYRLRDNALFTETTDLSKVQGPLMLIFEDGSCYDCDEFHEGVLSHAEVQKEIAPYTIVRLDADSTEALIDIDGSQTTAKALARKHQVLYRPGVLVFDEGELVHRLDSLVYHHHFKEGMRFIAGGYYKTQDYRSWSDARTEELLEAGVDIYLGAPEKP